MVLTVTTARQQLQVSRKERKESGGRNLRLPGQNWVSPPGCREAKERSIFKWTHCYPETKKQLHQKEGRENCVPCTSLTTDVPCRLGSILLINLVTLSKCFHHSVLWVWRGGNGTQPAKSLREWNRVAWIRKPRAHYLSPNGPGSEAWSLGVLGSHKILKYHRAPSQDSKTPKNWLFLYCVTFHVFQSTAWPESLQSLTLVCVCVCVCVCVNAHTRLLGGRGGLPFWWSYTFREGRKHRFTSTCVPCITSFLILSQSKGCFQEFLLRYSRPETYLAVRYTFQGIYAFISPTKLGEPYTEGMKKEREVVRVWVCERWHTLTSVTGGV